MNTKLSKSTSLLTGTLSLLAVFLLAAVMPAKLADSQTLPIRPTLTPTTTPIVSPTPTVTTSPIAPPNVVPTPSLAAIYLRVEPITRGLWTAVQWHDGDEWRSVEGWQAPLNDEGIVAWAVAEANFGERPFRWLVYDGPEGKLLASSKLFALPDFAHEIVYVTVTLPDNP